MKKKILIFTASMGSGHITAAQGLQDRFLDQGFEVEIIDVLPWTVMGKLSRWSFSWLGKNAQWFLEFIFHASSYPNPTWLDVFFYGLWMPEKKVKLYFTNLEDIDEVWTTFPALSLGLQKYWKTEIHVQITDYTTPHLSWIWGENVIVHALDEESKQYIHSFDASKKVEVAAFPLPKKFYKALHYSFEEKQAIRKKLLFSESEEIIVFFFHHILLGGETEMVDAFLQNEQYKNTTAVIIAGNHTAVFSKFKNHKNIRIKSYISHIEDYYAIANAVCGKCGGAFISESMLFLLPICISGVFSGQEKGNKVFLETHYSQNVFVL